MMNDKPVFHEELIPFGHENYSTKYYHAKKRELGKSIVRYFASCDSYECYLKAGFIPKPHQLLVFTCSDGQSNLLVWIESY